MIRRVVVPIAGAAATAAAIAAAAFAVVSALPQPTRSDRIGVRVLRFLETRRGHGSRMTIDGKRVVARCHRLAGARSLVSLSDGNTFVLNRARIRDWREPERLLAATSPPRAILRAAEADLAGSYRLYASELASQLAAGLRVVGHPARISGRPAYAIELASERPRVALLVDRETLRPLSARFESRQLSGEAMLARPGSGDEAATC